MGNPVNVSLQLPAAVGNGIALSQSAAGAAPLTINGSLASSGVATLSPARRVVISSQGNDSGITFALAGTDRRGNPQSETIAGTNAGSAYSVLDYLTVTSIKTSGATASTVTAGTNGVGSTDWQAWTLLLAPFQVGMAVEGDGATTYTVEHTYDDPNAAQAFTVSPNSNVPPVPWSDQTLDGLTQNMQGSIPGAGGIPSVVWASRLTITAGTGTVKFQAIQAGITQ